MDQLNLIQVLEFLPKENTADVFQKAYSKANGYVIEVDFEKKVINYGDKVKGESRTTQNFSQEENWVVLECVDRLLEKGYKPEDITLEKVFPSGHGHSGRLDVFVQKEGKAFLMIECKNFGKEYEKELRNIYKNGGQLFTYFQNDTNTQYLMLYASSLKGTKVDAHWDIVKIEDHYRGAGNVVDFFDRWSKVTYQNGIFEDWVGAYDFKNKLLTKKELLPLKETDSEAIFHGFMAILRKHSVSDEPNAFNKIFNLFLAKIYDEKKRDHDELEFQWREKIDDPVEFQVRLINLYQKGMYEFLRKEVEGISDEDFKASSPEELHLKKKKWLMFNNVFAIKEVIDGESFDDNHRVLKEVVELLHKYQIRYPRRQAHLSDFFERLLTTGLKQKAGQYFSPPPITRFITRSLPLKELINEELQGETAKLPAVIDYAVGSGHFITEIMEEYQSIIDNDIDTTNLYPDVVQSVEVWQRKKYDWAAKYIYGIEKDYRLVKVAKVGCYFYGDGLAQIIHGDGLDSFKDSNSYVGRLKKINDSELEKFSIVVSNPPYSVPTFKGDLKNKNANKDFELFDLLSDRSSEIECLFIERAKQLLKDGGLAAIILPSSILSNAGNLYTKTREIILQNFDIVAITEFGGNTFMATNTNTVTLFLRRRYKKTDDIKASCHQSLVNAKDVTINGLQKSLSKYVNQVWENTSLADYSSLLHRKPNDVVSNHDIYKEYRKKIKARDEKEFWSIVLQKEEEKLFFFVLTQQQKVVLVKAADKDVEKDFLGYEFSNRRGNEGMFAREKGKTIDECTKMYSVEGEDPTKANYYITKAFQQIYNLDIAEELRQHVSYVDLVDMITFTRIDFDKGISLSAKQTIRYEEVWQSKDIHLLSELAEIKKGTSITKSVTEEGDIPVIAGGQEAAYYHNKANRSENVITISASGAYAGFVNYFTQPIFASDCNTIQSKDEKVISTKLIFEFLKSIQNLIYNLQRGQAQPHVYAEDLSKIKIPLPIEAIQAKIVREIDLLEKNATTARDGISKYKIQIKDLFKGNGQTTTLDKVLESINPDKGDFITKLSEDAKVSFLSMPDVSNKGEIINLQRRSLKTVNKGFTFFQKDDVLFAKITPCMENGKGALVSDLENNVGFGSTEFFVLRPDKTKILPKILFYISQSEELRYLAEKSMTGASGHRRVPKTFLEAFEIPNFTLLQQQEIVLQINQIEKEVKKLEQQIAEIPHQRAEILKKYLN